MFALGVDVDVDVVVVVDLDGDGDVEVVATFDAALRSPSRACNDTFEQLGARLVALLGDELAQLHDVERGRALHGFATSDLVAASAVGFGPTACSFGDVAHDGLGGSGQLVHAIGMTARQDIDEVVGQGKKSMAR